MISYEGLEKALKKKGIGKSQLTNIGLSSRTIAKIAKGERLSRRSIQRIAEYLGAKPELLVRRVSENKILQTLREEKDMRLTGGAYGRLQAAMTYNSGSIDGIGISEERIRHIFENNVVDAGETVCVDDLLETIHHFRAIDYIIDTAEMRLTEGIIKILHYILKHDTRDASDSSYALGDYRRLPGTAEGMETAGPSEIRRRMKSLLEGYDSADDIGIEDIIAFHAEFERIGPFQNANGRVGRLIALKECLRHNIMPFMIGEEWKNTYFTGLKEWEHDRGCLTDVCLKGQNAFARLIGAAGE